MSESQIEVARLKEIVQKLNKCLEDKELHSGSFEHDLNRLC